MRGKESADRGCQVELRWWEDRAEILLAKKLSRECLKR